MQIAKSSCGRKIHESTEVAQIERVESVLRTLAQGRLGSGKLPATRYELETIKYHL